MVFVLAGDASSKSTEVGTLTFSGDSDPDSEVADVQLDALSAAKDAVRIQFVCVGIWVVLLYLFVDGLVLGLHRTTVQVPRDELPPK